VYVNDFEGGELYYTDIDLEFAPQKGDLIVHSASSKYKHGVKPVTKGPRYAYTNFITLAKDSPMTLEEYLDDDHTEMLKQEAKEKGINAPAF
jgi:predicted 2-oxoglutarate/Fe(II)-dependent dioxygenase YbiX